MCALPARQAGDTASAHLVSQSGLLLEDTLDSEAQRRRAAAFLPGAPSGSCSLLTLPKPLVRPATDTWAPERTGHSQLPRARLPLRPGVRVPNPRPGTQRSLTTQQTQALGHTQVPSRGRARHAGAERTGLGLLFLKRTNVRGTRGRERRPLSAPRVQACTLPHWGQATSG